jgi:DNA-binding transcriptional LysR family regulator
LEERLGARLLLRSTRGLAPTDAGQRFYDHAIRAIDESGRAEQAVRESSDGLSGRLPIGAAVAFARSTPHLSINIALDDRSIDFLEEGVDVALRMGALDDSSMTAHRISTRRRVVSTPSYFAEAGLPQTAGDLNRHQAVVYSVRDGGESWLFSRSDGSDSNVTLSGRINVNAAEGMNTAVLAHIGFAVASE